MDDPNITMEEYIRLQEEKAQRAGRTLNWKTGTYGKVKYYEDEDDCFTNFKSEFPAIVFDDTSNAALSCEPTVSPLNDNKIDFRISFDESDDEDYMNEFPDIVYNDALTSKSDFLTEPTENKDNDIDEIDIEQSSRDMYVIPLPNVINTDDGAYALSTVGISMAYPGVWIRQPSEEIDNVGGEFINLEISKCWSLEISRRLFNTLFAQELKFKNHLEQNIRGVFSF
ncbi:hypothetical protein Tco_0138623 [Tanacetum coccineum]